jgi:hypothetical protein
LSEPPGPLLLERRVETGEDEFAERVTADGGVWTGGTVEAALEGGEWRFERGEEQTWRHEGTLGDTALAALRDAIARSGFFETPPEHRPAVPVIHASRETWTAELEGRRHTATLHARGAMEVPSFTALAAALEQALASADDG